jgi:DNA-directed RNA polymerase specialized sigma24 family protein
MRRRERHHRAASTDEAQLSRSTASPLDEAIANETRQRILEQLAEDDKDMIKMCYMDKVPAAEIARRVGRPVTWVYRRLHQIRTRLRGILAG